MRKKCKHLFFFFFGFLMFHSVYGQKPAYVVAKEETLTSKDHGRTMYQITFKDGIKGKICQSPDGKWWTHRVIGSDKGPFSKEEATALMYKTAKEGGESAEKIGADATNAAMSKDKKKMYTDSQGKYYKDKNGNKVYVK